MKLNLPKITELTYLLFKTNGLIIPASALRRDTIHADAGYLNIQSIPIFHDSASAGYATCL